ncbi:MAG TPA: zinc ribbon domain-containing protein [bacterium]|nr:zinc ribbon domain-containing protein [bacterium]
MKNKKILFGIIFLFAITGFSNIQSAFAVDHVGTINIPSSSYAWYYMGYLENGDTIVINDIDSDGGIDVYIMKQWQFDELQEHGYFYSEKMWENIITLKWPFDVTGSGDYYYIVLENEALLFGRTVYIDLSVDYWEPSYIPNILLEYVNIIVSIVVIILVIAIPILLIRRHKRKTPKEVIVFQEREVSKIIYCRECGAEILDKTHEFCSSCGTKI